MLFKFLDWLFGCQDKGYKLSPLESSIMRILSYHTGLLPFEIQTHIHYINPFLEKEFNGVLERLELVGLAECRDGKWYKVRRES